MINLAIVGTGDMSHAHVEAFNRIDDVKIVAACDVNKNKLDAFVKKYNIENQLNESLLHGKRFTS